jgi:hypothetical protein
MATKKCDILIETSGTDAFFVYADLGFADVIKLTEGVNRVTVMDGNGCKYLVEIDKRYDLGEIMQDITEEITGIMEMQKK